MPNAHSSPQPTWQILAELNLPSQPGADQLARDYMAAAVHSLNLAPADLERLKTVVAEAVLNVIKHGNRYRSALPVSIQLRVSAKAVAEQITDQGDAPVPAPETSHLTTKVSEQEPSRSWGFFLIERMVDDTQITGEDTHYSIELFLYLE